MSRKLGSKSDRMYVRYTLPGGKKSYIILKNGKTHSRLFHKYPDMTFTEVKSKKGAISGVNISEKRKRAIAKYMASGAYRTRAPRVKKTLAVY